MNSLLCFDLPTLRTHCENFTPKTFVSRCAREKNSFQRRHPINIESRVCVSKILPVGFEQYQIISVSAGLLL